jgi:hypothetical protein
MDTRHAAAQGLVEKIRDLLADKIAEVADFVDFLRHRIEENRLASAVTRLSEQAFAGVWDTLDDAVYDEL